MNKHIWLSPRCGDERTWCQDDIGPCDECGEPTVEYVRADLYDAAIQALEALTKERDELRGALKPFLGDATMELLLWGGMPDDALGTVSVCLGDFRRARAAQRSPANAE